jgi:hypothetical protein
MSFLATAAAVCFIACHGGPADHFATFAENLSKNVGAIEVYASGPALKKFQEHGVEVTFPFSLDEISSEEEDALAEKIAKGCATASVVITDVGHPFDVKIQKALAQYVAHVPRLAYYDNPESFVPGGYSKIAAVVMLESQGILFANSNLTRAPIFQDASNEVDFGCRKRVGIGYYPIFQAEKMAKRRMAEQFANRQRFLAKNGLVDTGQKIIVYFGGNNEEYFAKALPAFLGLLEEGMGQSDFTNLVIVIQQHPGAKKINLDGTIVTAWIKKFNETAQAPKMILSDFTTDDALTITDGAFYFQTSMSPQFVLAGIPTIQIGHETFQDILVKNHLSPSVTNVNQLMQVIDALSDQKKEIPEEVIFKGLGIEADWLANLENALRSCPRT